MNLQLTVHPTSNKLTVLLGMGHGQQFHLNWHLQQFNLHRHLYPVHSYLQKNCWYSALFSQVASKWRKSHQARVHLFSLSYFQFYFLFNETNTLSFVNLWRPYHSNFSTYLSDLILVYTKQTEKGRLQNQNSN